MKKHEIHAICICFVISFLSVSSLYAGDKWGMACGFVKDAVTKQPLDGASVTLLSTLEKGETKEETTTVPSAGHPGWYCAKVVIGTYEKATKYNPLRGGLIFGIKKVTYATINKTSATVKVIKEGYKEFSGTVPFYMAIWGGKWEDELTCDSIRKTFRDVNCKKLPKDVSDKILLQDIYLSPADSEENSYAITERKAIKILEVSLDPQTAARGKTVNVSVTLSLPDDPWVKAYWWWKYFRISALKKQDFDDYLAKMQDEAVKKKPKVPRPLFVLRNTDKGKTPTFKGKFKAGNSFTHGANEIVLFFNPGVQQGAVLFLRGTEVLKLRGERDLLGMLPSGPGAEFGFPDISAKTGIIPEQETTITLIVE